MGIFNIIWFVFFGWWQALVFILLAVFFGITILGIPLAKSLLEFAKLSAFPFGKEIISEKELKGDENISKIRSIAGTIMNLVWLPFGISIAIMFVFTGIVAFITIIFIPVGVVYVRMAKFVIWPLGAKVVTKKEAYASAVAYELKKGKE